MTAGRPRPVVRHLRRPLWWVAVSFSVTAVLLVLTVRDAEHLREGRNRWPRVVASVPVSYSNGRHEVPISYRHPVTGQVVDTKVVVVTPRSAARQLRVALATLRDARWRKRARIPFVKVGGRIVGVAQADLNAALERGRETFPANGDGA